MTNTFFGRPSIIRFLHAREPADQSGPLFDLPSELREVIYANLLTPADDKDPPKGEGIHPNILRTCRQLSHEASTYLYQIKHTIRYSSTLSPHWRVINASSLRFLQNINIRLEFSTSNRGECEIAVQHAERIANFTESIMLTLQHSKALRSLHVELCNLNQRKVGKMRLRSEECMQQVRNILWPFAYLPISQRVTIGGFDTVLFLQDIEFDKLLTVAAKIAFVDMFQDMRRTGASREFVLDLQHGEVRYGIL